VNDPGILSSLKIHSTALMVTFTTVITLFMKEETMHFESVCTVEQGRKRIDRRKGLLGNLPPSYPSIKTA
jgi:hypothetical protein